MATRTHTQGLASMAPTRDGREMHYVESRGPHARTTPTVVFEGGLGETRSYWALVQNQLGQWNRSVAYDRAGLGRSPADAAPRTLERLAGDLHDLLDHLGEGPFILVAHGSGGPIVRAAAAERRDRIAGMVLVDVTDECCDVHFEPAFLRMERVEGGVCGGDTRLGLLPPLCREQFTRLPDDVQAEFRDEAFTADAIRERSRELPGMTAGLDDFRRCPPDLTGIPLTVISAGLPGSGLNGRTRNSVNASHKYRAQLAHHGRHVVAENSGHFVPFSEPDVIVEEVLRLQLAAVDGSPAMRTYN